MAEIYENLGASIKGNAIIAQGYNRIIWDDMSEEGILALVELESDKWIDFHVIDVNEFLEDRTCLKESLQKLPVAQPIKIRNSDYEFPHWLPIKRTFSRLGGTANNFLIP